jgi:hypothetical protein
MVCLKHCNCSSRRSYTHHRLPASQINPGLRLPNFRLTARFQKRALDNFRFSPSSFQEGMIEKRPITLMGRTTDVILATLLSLRTQVNGNHNRVHASLKSSRGPLGMRVAGSP